MRTIYLVNGHTRVHFGPSDIDGDGSSGGVEDGNKRPMEIDAVETTDLKDAFDTMFPKGSNNTINMMGNIDRIERESLFKILALVEARFLPRWCANVVRQFIELSVSDKARGRNDGVEITTGKMANDREAGIGQKMNNLMGRS